MNAQGKEILLILWPDLETVDYGWMLLNGEMLTTIVIYAVLGLIYFGLVLMVRSKRMWILQDAAGPDSDMD